MNRIHITYLISILFFTVNCSYVKNVNLLLSGEIKRKNYIQKLPFEFKKDIIIVKARLNADTTEREFIFDTGAFNSKVELGLANELQLEVITKKENSTAQGLSRKIEVVRIDSLQIGETLVNSVGAGKVDYDGNSSSPCLAKDGIIGANIIKLANWKIDYQEKMMYFSDLTFPKKNKTKVLPFSRPILSGVPSIEIKISGKTVINILFDVGFNGGLVLPINLANQFSEKVEQIILDKSTSGIYGTNADSIIAKKLLVSVAGFQTEMPVEFSSLNKALLGNEFLKHFQVSIDNENREIHLEQKETVSISKPRDFLLGIANDSTWIVNRTSPKYQLKLGDLISSVNGKKPIDLFSSHCDHVMNYRKLADFDSYKLVTVDNRMLRIENDESF